MIKKYFDNMMNHFLDEKNYLEKQLIQIDNRMKEIDRFVEILDEQNDISFESFTPREVNPKNKEKIKELEQEKRTLKKEQVDVRKKLKETEISIDEFTAMIQQMKNQEMERKQEIEQKAKSENVSREINMEIQKEFQEIDSIINRINDSIQFIDVDVIRTKLELRQLIPQLQEQINIIKTYCNYEDIE